MRKKMVTFRIPQNDATWLKLIAIERKCSQVSIVNKGLGLVITSYIQELPTEIINRVLDEIQREQNILKDGEL